MIRGRLDARPLVGPARCARSHSPRPATTTATAPDWPTSEFHFVRMYYRDGGYSRGWGDGSWTVDYPEAE